jgi:DNA-binding transcriptional LysR family regulator
MRYDLIDLRLFVQVLETRSITRGADQSNMSLASASARIRGMEAVLGVPLLHREPRGVRPTPAGQALLRHAQLMLQHHERMRGELGNFARGLKGYVKLLSNTIATTEFLPKALALFLASHPNVDIELEERNSEEIVQAVSEGYADAGIIIEMSDHGELQTFPFESDRLVLITPPGHSLAKSRRLEFRDVVEQEFVGLSPGRALGEFLNRQAARAGHTLKLRVRMTSFDAICQMVELGAGVAIVPEKAARRYRRAAISIVSLTDKWVERRLSICCREYGALSDHAKRLIHHLTARDRAWKA